MCINTYRNKRGFTMIELIVSMAIISVLTLSAFSLAQVGNRLFAGGNNQYGSQHSARLTADYFTKAVRFATEMEVLNAMPTAKVAAYNYFYIENGSLHHEVYDSVSGTWRLSAFGEGMAANAPFIRRNDHTLGIVLHSVHDTKDYSVLTDIFMPNLQLFSEQILPLNATTGSVVVYSTVPPAEYYLDPEDPDPDDPIGSYVQVTFTVNNNNSTVILSDDFNGSRTLTGSGNAKSFVFVNVPANTTASYTIYTSNGSFAKDAAGVDINNRTLVIGAGDFTVFQTGN